MNDPTKLGYRFHLPVGQELLPLLEQPYISSAVLRDLFRRRGTFVASVEKKDLISKILLSYLSPHEFDYLMSIVIERESGNKVRNDYNELEIQSNIPLADGLPSENDFRLVRDYPIENQNFTIKGNPNLERINDKHYRITYSIQRRNPHSNWLKSEQTFTGTVDVIKDDKRGLLKFEAWHTSEETRRVNRFITKSLRKALENSHVILADSTKTIRFNSFTNEQRIAFLMKFTGSFDKEIFAFEKLVDLSLKVDESSSTKDHRISWMKKKVSKLNVSGTDLEDTFFVTDKSCRPHLLFWRFECRYSFETADGKGSIILAFEFGGYSKTCAQLAPFQITRVRLNASKYNGNLGSIERKIISRLNGYQMEFAENVLKGDLAEV